MSDDKPYTRYVKMQYFGSFSQNGSGILSFAKYNSSKVNDFHQNLQAVHFSINYSGVGVYATLNLIYHESY